MGRKVSLLKRGEKLGGTLQTAPVGEVNLRA